MRLITGRIRDGPFINLINPINLINSMLPLSKLFGVKKTISSSFAFASNKGIT